MSFWTDPIGSVSGTLNHVSDVISNDPTAKAVATIGAIAGAAYLTGGLSLAGTAGSAETGAAIIADGGGTTAAMAGGFGETVAVSAPVTTASTGASIWTTAANAGKTVLSGIDTAGKVVGAASLISRATGGAAGGMPAGGSASGTVFGPAALPPTPPIAVSAPSAIAPSGGPGAGAATAPKSAGMDAPTILAVLASVATIALFFRR
jgi:hypothetical protein